MKYLNPFHTPNNIYSYEYYEHNNPLFTLGEYSIFKLSNLEYHHTKGDVIITMLGGINKELLTLLHNKEKPTDGNEFIYNRCLETIEKVGA